MNYTITLTYMELINIAALLGSHIELCKDLAQEAEASEYQVTLDKIRFRIAGRPDPEEVHLTEEELRYCWYDVQGLCEALDAQMARDGYTHAPRRSAPR